MPRGENTRKGAQGFQKTNPKDLPGTAGVNPGAGAPTTGSDAARDSTVDYGRLEDTFNKLSEESASNVNTGGVSPSERSVTVRHDDRLVMSAEKMQEIADAIAEFDTPERRQAYREGRFPRSEKVKDLNRRYRWDLYHATEDARSRNNEPRLINSWIGGPEEHLKDAHVDTALRRIVPPL